jgi:hypothetical protein
MPFTAVKYNIHIIIHRYNNDNINYIIIYPFPFKLYTVYAFRTRALGSTLNANPHFRTTPLIPHLGEYYRNRYLGSTRMIVLSLPAPKQGLLLYNYYDCVYYHNY